MVSRDGFGSPVPRQPAHLHAQAEYDAYLRDSSRVPRRRPFMEPPYAIGSVPSLSGHAIAYRWRSLPRVRRHRASKPQGSSERVLPCQVTMDQLIYASRSYTRYWYEVGMLKVPADECGRVFPAGVGPGSLSRNAANWLPSQFSLSVETRRWYGWLRMVFPGARLFRAPILVPFGRVAARERQGALSRRAW